MVTIDLSTLTDELRNLWYVHVDYGWIFCWQLRDGLAELKEELGTQYNERELLEQMAEALDMKYKTLYNKLLIARKPWGKLAKELTLDIGHADAVSGLEDEQAIDMLHRAAEQRWTVQELRREVYMSKSTILKVRDRETGMFMMAQVQRPPGEGIGLAEQYDVAESDVLLDDEPPPYCNDAFYQDTPLGVRPYDYSRELLEQQRIKVREMIPPFQQKHFDKLLDMFEQMVRADERERVG